MPKSTIRTSRNNPLKIATVAAGLLEDGLIGLTFAPGKQQPGGISGAHRRDLATDLDVIARWNAAAVVCLVEQHELDQLGISNLGAEVRRRHMEWHHWPIRDYGVPDDTFNAAWPARSKKLRDLLDRGGRVLIHCKGGLGRTGMVAARLLKESFYSAADAIAAVRSVRPGSVETLEQERWVDQLLPSVRGVPRKWGLEAMRDRALGALLGLSVGDAIGAAIEFSPKPRFALLDDMVGGGPHRLQRGQWTDDTAAMALALGESLLQAPELDPVDLMRRFLDWWDNGTYSCTGTCFDIGNATRSALERFRATGEPLAGSSNPSASGNGALMRLAPVAIRHWRNHEVMQQVAETQTRTTHGSPATLTASRILSELLAEAIEGASLTDLLAMDAVEGIDGGWRRLSREDIQGSGFVTRSLQAALGAISRTTDSLVCCLAFGWPTSVTMPTPRPPLPANWLARFMDWPAFPMGGLPPWPGRDRLAEIAEHLFDAGCPPPSPSSQHPEPDPKPELGTPFAAVSMTGDWSLRERLKALASFKADFERPGFVFGESHPGKQVGYTYTSGWVFYGEVANRLSRTAYAYGWVRVFDWSSWHVSEEGTKLWNDPGAISEANEDELARVITTHMRGERFSDGHLQGAFEAGVLTAIVTRAGELLALAEDRFGRVG